MAWKSLRSAVSVTAASVRGCSGVSAPCSLRDEPPEGFVRCGITADPNMLHAFFSAHVSTNAQAPKNTNKSFLSNSVGAI